MPRALALLGGPEAAPALLAVADRCLEEDLFGDVLTDGLADWLECMGREGPEHCASVAGRAGNSWLVESAALETVAAWVRGHPEDDAWKAAVVERSVASLGGDAEEDKSTLGHRVYRLAEWRVTEAPPAVEAAVAAGRVDTSCSGSIERIRLRVQGREPHRPWLNPLDDLPPSGLKVSGLIPTSKHTRREKKKRRKRRNGR